MVRSAGGRSAPAAPPSSPEPAADYFNASERRRLAGTGRDARTAQQRPPRDASCGSVRRSVPSSDRADASLGGPPSPARPKMLPSAQIATENRAERGRQAEAEAQEQVTRAMRVHVHALTYHIHDHVHDHDHVPRSC